MSDILIVGVHNPAHVSRTVDFAVSQAKKSGAELHFVQVIEWSPYSFHTAEELAERHKRRDQEIERALAIVKPIADKVNASGGTATCEVRHGHAGEILCEIAKNKKATQIVIGRTGSSSLTQRLLGGLAITLAQISPVPLTIVP
ncbi:MAG: universal stress protein [Sneathiella sp.]|nr:MAG: universal stress protein [Sneathiella sp.]